MHRRLTPLLLAAAFRFASVEGAMAQSPDETERREALQLCYSTDVAAQRFCLRRISELSPGDQDARRALTHLARQPGAAGDDARVLYRLRYGEDVAPAAPTAPPEQPGALSPPSPPPAAPAAPPVPAPPPQYAPTPQQQYVPPPPQQQYAPPPPQQQYVPPPPQQQYAPPPQYGQPPQHYPSTAPPPLASRQRPNDPSRIHLTNTGFSLGAGKRFFTFQGPHLYEIGAGITDHLQIEGTTLFPAALVSALVTLKYGLRFEAGGLTVFGGLGGVYMPAYDNVRGGTGIFRGGAALSLGTPDTFFNLSAELGGGFYHFEALDPTEGGQIFALLSAGFNARISGTTHVRAEGLVPGVYRSGSASAGFGAFGMVGWGFRFQAHRAVVDASFYYPLHSALWPMYEIWPVGLPWISVALPF